MKHWLCIAPLAITLTACGGDSGGSGSTGNNDDPGVVTSPTQPANLSSPDAAAAFVLAFTSFSDSAESPVQQKAVTTEDCPTSGTQSYDDETGVTVFDECTASFNGTTIIVDGQQRAVCTADDSPDVSNCDDVTNTFGDGSTPLSTSTATAESEQLIEFLGTGRFVDAETSSTSTLNLQLSLDQIRPEAPELIMITDDLVVFDEFDAGVDETSINGGFGTNAITSCGGGFVTFETISPITTTESSDNPVSGELNLTSDNGTSANLVFNSDGSVTITVDGDSQTYTEDDLNTICSG